jgi:hypothetical protein
MPKIAKRTTPKSDFIRAQPPTMSAVDVVAKAKSQKLKISRALVYMVRGRSDVKTKKTGAKATARSPGTATASRSTSKAAFIRSLPKTMPVKDVVAMAKAKGIHFDEPYVYWARRPSKGTATRKRASTAVRNGPSIARAITTTSSAEALLLALGAEIGLGKAVEILEGERAKVRAAIGG